VEHHKEQLVRGQTRENLISCRSAEAILSYWTQTTFRAALYWAAPFCRQPVCFESSRGRIGADEVGLTFDRFENIVAELSGDGIASVHEL
jgi:hypothetical protein